MIVLKAVTKVAWRGRARRLILDRIDATFESGVHYAILGGRGSGKSTLLRLLGDLQKPTKGSITRFGTVSLPMGYSVNAGDKTGRQLVHLVSDLYGSDTRAVLDFVAQFSELDDALELPLSALEVEARARLFYSLGYAIPVDFYLFDGIMATGDASFQARCRSAFESRRRTAGTIFATRDPRQAKAYGERGGVLHGGRLFLYDSVDEAIDVFEGLELESKVGTLSYAQGLAGRGDLQGAQEYVERYITDIDSDDNAAYSLLGELALKSGNLDDAAKASWAALDREPDQAGPHLMLAKIAERGHRLGDATTHAMRALEFEPSNRNAAMLLAKVLDADKKYAQAAEVWRYLGEIDRNPLCLRMAIRSDTRAENWAGVLQSIETIRGYGAFDASLEDLRTQALIETDRLDDAYDAVLEVAAVDFGRAIAALYRLAQKGRWSAIARLVQTLEADAWGRHRSNRTALHFIILLERQLAAATREGRTVEADELRNSIKIVSPDRSASLAPVQGIALQDTISIGKPVFMSSQHREFRAEHGNDGEIAAPGKMFCTKYESEPWWKVDLGEVVPIKEIHLFDWVEQIQRSTTLLVEVSADDQDYRVVYDRGQQAAGAEVGPRSSNSAVPTTKISLNAAGRWVRLRLRDTNYLHMRQVVVVRDKSAENDGQERVVQS